MANKDEELDRDRRHRRGTSISRNRSASPKERGHSTKSTARSDVDSESGSDSSSSRSSDRHRHESKKSSKKKKKTLDVDKKRKHHKKDKKKKRESKKDKRHSEKGKLSSKEERMLKEAKKILAQGNGADQATVAGQNLLTEEDFYLKSTEFRVWLQQDQNLNFEDLTTEKSTKYFKKFVARWNEGKLATMYYQGLPQELVEEAKKSKHKWSFTSRLSEREKFQLASTADSVSHTTEKPSTTSSSTSAMPPPASRTDRGALTQEREMDRRYDKETENERRSDVDRRQRKRRHNDMKDYLEDIAPKATGRDALIEKRREKGARIHGAVHDRDSNMDGLDVKEDTLMGGGDDFHRMLARQKERRNAKQTAMAEKRNACQAAEEEKMKKFMADMGLVPGQKVTIAPRNT